MTDLGSIYGTTVDGSNTLVIDFSNVDICGNLNVLGDVTITTLNANTISQATGNVLRLYTDPTTQVIEVRTAQLYPLTNNATILGGASNRWSIGYFGKVDTNDIYSGDYINYVANLFDHNFTVRAGFTIKLNGVIIHTASSDDRIKFNETLVSNGLDVINKVNIYKYDKVYEIGHDPTKDPYRKEVGVIAQEIQKIPELAQAVCINEVPPQQEQRFPNGIPLSVYYDQIHSYHIKATQELDIIVQNQQTEITELKNENTLLKNSLNILLSEAGKPTI